MTGLNRGFLLVVLLLSLERGAGVGAQAPPPTGPDSSVGGYGVVMPDGTRSSGTSMFYPPNSRFPVTIPLYGNPYFGTPDNPIVGGGVGRGRGYGFGYPATAAAYSPVGGYGFATYGYPDGSQPVGGLGGIAPPLVFTPRVSPPTTTPKRGREVSRPSLPPVLTPLVLQSALRTGPLIQSIGVRPEARGGAANRPPRPSVVPESAPGPAGSRP